MDFTSFWFLLIMVFVGGLVAVLADNLGRKLGKSRLRVGKLRPRHTAMLFTAITGAAVTLITILLVATLSAEVRQWIIKGREAVKENQRSVEENKRIRSTLSETLGQLNDANGQLAGRRREISELQKNLERAASDTKRFEKLADTAEGRASNAASLLQKREADLKKLSNDLKKASQNLNSVNATYSKLTATYAKLDENFSKLRENYATLEKQTDTSYKQNRELQNQNMELENANGKLLKDIEALNGQINRGQAQLNQLLASIKTSSEQLETAVQVADMAIRNGRGARILPIIYHLNDEIVRRDIGLTLTLADAENQVRTTLSLAADAIYRRTNKEMSLFEVITGTITPDTMISRLSRQLLDSKGPTIIAVTVPVNIFGDEPVVPVNIEIVSNSVVFKKGEVLGEVRVEGGTVEKIIEQIGTMLRTQVRQKAIQVKMRGAEDSEAFGTVSPSETVKLVNAIHEFGRPVRVQAVAKSDVRVSGPLEIEFKVR